MAPTERSISPVIITSTMPAAISPIRPVSRSTTLISWRGEEGAVPSLEVDGEQDGDDRDAGLAVAGEDRHQAIQGTGGGRLPAPAVPVWTWSSVP